MVWLLVLVYGKGGSEKFRPPCHASSLSDLPPNSPPIRDNSTIAPEQRHRMSRFRPIDRKTAYLLPPSVEDWLPQDHLARFIVEAIEQLDLSGLTRAYAGRGSAAYHPEILLSLLVYGLVHYPPAWVKPCACWPTRAIAAQTISLPAKKPESIRILRWQKTITIPAGASVSPSRCLGARMPRRCKRWRTNSRPNWGGCCMR